MKNWTIRTRILAGFLVVMALETAAVAYFAVILTGVHQQVTGLTGIENLVEADRDAYQSHLAVVSLTGGIVPPGETERAKAFEAVDTNLAQIGERFEKFREIYRTKDDRLIGLINGFGAQYEAFSKETARMAEAAKSGAKNTLELYNTAYLPSFDKMRTAIDDITGITYELALERTASISVIINNITTFVVIGIIILITLTVILSLWITRSISKQINRAIRELSSSSGQIASASGQLAKSSQEIANGAIEQASSIEETTSSIEELASMVRQNANNAKEASGLAETTSSSSEDGAQYMDKMLEAMRAINQDSNRINKIIKVIDDIAFQTNMLALNAAVEAARAGEAGMGFAVVAEEVKNLANRSADAARETAEMIEASIARTADGLAITEQLTKIFTDIRANGRKLLEMSREVETASRQQDIGIDQVNKAILQFDEVVQSNAGSAEETASAATELQTQVDSLNILVGELTSIVFGKKRVRGAAGEARDGSDAKPKTERAAENPQADRDKPATGRTGKSLAAREQQRPGPRPDQLIPFEDDEELKRF